MPTPERQLITAWFAENGDATRNVQAVNKEMFNATSAWDSPPDDVLRDRTMTAARDLLAAVERCESLPPIGLPTLDAPMKRALADLRRGAEMLTSLPLDMGEATRQVDAAGPVLKAGYEGLGVVAQEAVKFGPA